MKKIRTRTKIKNKKKIDIKTLILILLFTSIIFFSFSKYTVQVNEKHIQTSEEFYFASDMLSENGNVYELYDWDGINEYLITIDLRNSEDFLRYTEKDITYNISVTGSDNITVNMENTSRKIIGGNANKATERLSIRPKTILTPGSMAEVEVTATTNSPYEKTIIGTFRIYVKNASEYTASLNNSSDYSTLNIKTSKIDGKSIIIQYDSSKVILDTTNSIFEGQTIVQNGTQNTITTNSLQNNESYLIEFIKKDSNNIINLGTDIVVK